jgi:hypothetical protein
MGKKDIRVNLRFSQELKERLEKVCELSGSGTLSETIRRALALYDTLLEATSSGKQLVIKGENGEEQPVLLTFK